MKKISGKSESKLRSQSSSVVPNLGYMYPQGYICLSEGVHLRLSTEEQNTFEIIIFQIFAHISVTIIFKNHYTLIVKYINE